MATMFPGGVESNISGAGPGFGGTMEQLAWQRYQDEQKEKRKQEWASAAAKNNAAVAAKNAALQPTPEQNLKATFDATYGPQLQRAYQENAVQSAPTNTAAGKARDWAVGHGMTSGGTIGQPGTDVTKYAAGALQQPQMRPDQIQGTLDYMWRQQTDPYQQTANKMGGFMKMFHPSDQPAREYGATLTKANQKLKGKKEEEENPFQYNVGGGR